MSGDFRSLMNQMRDHCKSGATPAFVIPHHVQPMAAMGITPAMAVTPAGYAKLKAASSGQPPQTDEIFASVKSRAKLLVDEHKAAITDALNGFERDKDRSHLIRSLNAVRDKAKAGFDTLIDETYDKAIALEESSPELQQTILQQMNFVGAVISDAIRTECDFVEDAIAKMTGVVPEGPVADVSGFVENGFAPVTTRLSVL